MKKGYQLLTIGATGMLAKAVVALAENAAEVISVARTKESLFKLEADIVAEHGSRSPKLSSIPFDYQKQEELRRKIGELINNRDLLALVWMHGETESNGVINLAQMLAEIGSSCTQLWHVVGSGTARHVRTGVVEGAFPDFDGIPRLDYRRIILGSVKEGAGRRWLTHDEISSAVLEAIVSV